MSVREVSYITPAGFKRLSDEYHYLRHQERPRVVEEVSRAAAMGDRSENAEYIYGKRRLREIDSRLGFLDRRMEALQPVDPAQIKSKDVGFGATVKLEYEDGKIVTYHIVGEDEVDVPRNRISYKSPVGKALLRKREGDEAVIHRPAGPVEVTILELRYMALDP
ncbi:MAG: transcription elongation factor GreB [Myxococcota bacterium]